MLSPTAQTGDQELVGPQLPQAFVPGSHTPRFTTSSQADLLEQVTSRVTNEHLSAPLRHPSVSNDATMAALLNNPPHEENILLNLPQEGGNFLFHPPLFASLRHSVNRYKEADEVAREETNRKWKLFTRDHQDQMELFSVQLQTKRD